MDMKAVQDGVSIGRPVAQGARHDAQPAARVRRWCDRRKVRPVITQTMQQYGVRPDMVVAFFEAVSAVLICVSVVKLHKDKKVRGVSAWPVTFFALWGWWNIYWYAHIDAPYAWWAGLGVVAANTTWAVQMIYWVWREMHRAACPPRCCTSVPIVTTGSWPRSCRTPCYQSA
jgi:hypothetical protein